jgi:hypothetical protein
VLIAHALSALLPTRDETALLVACLDTGDRARNAWDEWRGGRGTSAEELRRDLARTRTLMPLLARSAARSRLDVTPDVLAYLRATTLREGLRAVRFRGIATEALSAFDRAGADVWVVRGAALAWTVYEEWAHRHCHDLDILVVPRHLARAIDALTLVDCVPIGSKPDATAGAVLKHSSGLQVALHTRPFAAGYYDVPVGQFAGGRSIPLEGLSARTPTREATLVHVLGHASYSSSRQNLRWVADAWHILAARPDLEWDQVVDRLEACRLTVPVSVLLRYLRDVGMPVPPGVVARAHALAADAPAAALDVAIEGACAGPGGGFRRLWQSTPSRGGRLRVVRWAVAPSLAGMRHAFPRVPRWLIPLCYLYRPARFVAAAVVGRARRPPAVARRHLADAGDGAARRLSDREHRFTRSPNPEI